MSVREPSRNGRHTRRHAAKPARVEVETFDILTADGWSLRADLREPAGEARGVAVLAHAMMARRSEFDRPPGQGLAQFLVGRGWSVVAFDFRGHGDSAPRAGEGARWGYDDLVARDVPAAFEFAKSRLRRKRPVVLVGHSLGGHVGLAAQGAGLVSFDGIVSLAANVWLRELEPLPPRWLAKRAVLAAVLEVSRRVGRFPARAVRIGSDDESLEYFEDVARFSRTGSWSSRDGTRDYLAGLAGVRVPVVQVVTDGDRLNCAPDCGARFVARCSGPREVVRVDRADDGGPAPDHMGLVTAGSARSAWARAEEWIRAHAVAR
jgi:predicted alpha/beta hydrolase